MSDPLSHSLTGVKGHPDPDTGLVFVANNIDEYDPAGASKVHVRQKRRHQKSRRGCASCKQRKVKCNEQVPCSNCVRRKERCTQQLPGYHHNGPEPLIPLGHWDIGTASENRPKDTHIDLLHMELFYHFVTHLQGTLAFRHVWPVILQRSFQEPPIMCTLLCLAATHLSFLRPSASQYSRTALQLLTQSVRLFRESLSDPITPQNCDALIGTSVLMQFLAWSNLDFLSPEGHNHNNNSSSDTNHHNHGHAQDDPRPSASASRGLDMSRDQLFLLSPGVRTLFFAAMPVMLNEGSGSAFLSVVVHRPRLRIEEAVRRMETMRGAGATGAGAGADGDPEEDRLEQLVARFNSLWDDPCYAGHDGDGGGLVPREGLESEAAGQHHHHHGSTCNLTWSLTAAKESFGYVARSVALVTLLCSAVAAAGCDDASALLQEGNLQEDLVRYFFTFPVFASGPFLDMARSGDARALVVLLHFYRAARVLLTADACWWARERSRVLEGLILQELEGRGLGGCVR